MSRLYLSNPCAFLRYLSHTVLRAQSALGFPCALYSKRDNEETATRAKMRSGNANARPCYLTVESESTRRAAREEREAFLALPKDERDRLEAERRAKMTPFHLAMEDAMREMARSMVAHMSRAATFDGGFTIPVGAKKGKARRT